MPKPEVRRAAAPAFFIPDLCHAQAALLLVLLAELLALVLSVGETGLREFSWSHFAMTSLFVQWTVLASAAALCQLRPRLAQWPRAWAAALCYALVLAIAAALSVTGQWLLRGLPGGNEWFDGWALLDNLVISAVLAGIALRYLYLAQELRQRQRAELEARLQALQARIRPHFLFNSMNSIASLIGIDPVAAEAAVEDLADLFRASLGEAEAEVTLAEELELCRRYLRIEQLRLGPRLQLDWQLDALPPGLPIPSLSLQPLLENAVYHGIQALPEGGVIRIEGSQAEGWVELSVSNPVPAPERARAPGNRLALDNIGRRLQALYGEGAGIEAARRDGLFHARLRYRPPVRPAADTWEGVE